MNEFAVCVLPHAHAVDLSLNASLDAPARDFDPNDSGSDFADELPALTQTRSPQRKLEGEDAIVEAEKRACESHLCRRTRAPVPRAWCVALAFLPRATPGTPCALHDGCGGRAMHILKDRHPDTVCRSEQAERVRIRGAC